MSILHLCFDGNFINNSFSVFEHYYPGQNFFLVKKRGDELQYIKENEKIKATSFESSDFPFIYQYCEDHKVDKIVLHGISFSFLPLLKYIAPLRKMKIYWIFWGYELYISLAQLGKYDLVDGAINILSPKTYMYPNKYNLFIRKVMRKNIVSNVLKEIIPYIDYFCFWNYRDYELLQKNLHTNIKFKFFAYSAAFSNDDTFIDSPIPEKNPETIMINHQASVTGNHATIMKRIAELDRNNQYTKIAPVSYGSPYIRKSILKEGKKLFGNKFNPILEYLPREEYFNIIDKVAVAIIGARRQEASGNIIHLLRNGVKVYLRNDNNLLDYYREKGYLIFSFEDDLNSLKDLSPLSIDEQKHNRECSIKNRLYYDQFMPSLFSEE